LETPPRYGVRQVWLDPRVASMKSTPYCCAPRCRWRREDVRIEDDVFGREADLFGQQLVGALADLDLALEGVGLACSSNAITTTAAP
jgi:hypothetical protein